MIATVTAGKAEAKVTVALEGISLADVLCEALGYGEVSLYGVLIQTVSPLRLYVQYILGSDRKSQTLLYASVAFEEVPA